MDRALLENRRRSKSTSLCRTEFIKETLLKLIYEDDGVGAPLTAKTNLFKEGYSIGGGTGYGLYLIGKIAKVYDWTIRETGEPKKGAQFIMTMPRVNANDKEDYRLI